MYRASLVNQLPQAISLSPTVGIANNTFKVYSSKAISIKETFDLTAPYHMETARILSGSTICFLYSRVVGTNSFGVVSTPSKSAPDPCCQPVAPVRHFSTIFAYFDPVTERSPGTTASRTCLENCSLLAKVPSCCGPASAVIAANVRQWPISSSRIPRL